MELWAIGRYDLRLSERGFWSLTLREFNALLKRLQRQDWEYYRSAVLCTLIANALSQDGKFTPQDFLPGKKRERKQTPEQMLAVVKLYQQCFEMKEDKKNG